MNTSTKEFLDSLHYPKSNKLVTVFIEKIQKIYDRFREYDEINITIDVLQSIFDLIEKIVYDNKFYKFLGTYPKIRSKINFVNDKNKLDELGAFCDTIRYDKRHIAYDKYDLGFNIELDAINSIEKPRIYYSGGYITKSRVIFIILILVHESLHIIEYKDSYLSRGNHIHSIFFYKYAYSLFGILSRLSEVFTIKQKDLLVFDTREREGIMKHMIVKNTGRNLNAEDLINDHSHYIINKKEELLGYITYRIFKKNRLLFLEDL